MNYINPWTYISGLFNCVALRNPSTDVILKLQDGSLADLLEAIEAGSLPPRDELRKLYGLPPLSRGPINCDDQPQTPSWANQDNPIRYHVPGGPIDLSQIVAGDIFGAGEEFLEGGEFMKRAQQNDSMNATACDLYSRPENWRHLPENVDTIVFANTIFNYADGEHCVRCLMRIGSKWVREHLFLKGLFGHHCRVARLKV